MVQVGNDSLGQGIDTKLSIKKCVSGTRKVRNSRWHSSMSSMGLQPRVGGVIGIENLEIYCKQAMRKKVNLSCSKI